MAIGSAEELLTAVDGDGATAFIRPISAVRLVSTFIGELLKHHVLQEIL